MTKILKTMFIILLIIILLHLPPVSTSITNKVNLTDAELSNLLTSIEIILSTSMAIFSLLTQRAAEKKCKYEFYIENDHLSLEGYRRFEVTENTFTYVCKRKDNKIETPYYGMQVSLTDNPIRTISIPLGMTVFTKLEGESISFSNLLIYIKSGEKIIDCKKISHGTVIEKTIQEKKSFLVRILLLCNPILEQILLNSCIYLSFTLTLKDNAGYKNKKYFFLKIQNTLGEPRLLSTCSKSNWISYVNKSIKLKQTYES